MKSLFSIVVFLISLATQAQVSQIVNYEPNSLMWSHYSLSSKPSGYQKAFTYCGISYAVRSDEKGLTAEFQAYVDLKESWVMKGAQSTQLLLHEQGFFDLTEIYARLMKQATLEYIKSEGPNLTYEALLIAVRNIYKEKNNQLFIEQQAYNVETRNGNDKEAQAMWNKKIQSRLAALEQYK
jgi:FtsZ-binding cell division protein ZapB